MTTFSQTQIMQQNLQMIRKNQNYFSCFIENLQQRQQPTNPFKKRLFDKNLRRSAVSCGHYNSSSNYCINDDSGESQFREMNSSRIGKESPVKDSHRYNVQNHENNQNKGLIQLQPLKTHILQIPSQPYQTKPSKPNNKITLTQSRHTDPFKNKVSQIINNFRLQLDYLQQKLHQKVDNFYQKSSSNQHREQRQLSFMLQNLDKIVGFMIQNCLNLEENIMYGDLQQVSEQKNRQEEEQQDSNTQRYAQPNNRQFHIKHPNQSSLNNRKNNLLKANFSQNKQKSNNKNNNKNKKRIVNINQKESILLNNKQNQTPNIYFINDKLHHDSDNQFMSNPNNNSSKMMSQKQMKSNQKYNNNSYLHNNNSSVHKTKRNNSSTHQLSKSKRTNGNNMKNSSHQQQFQPKNYSSVIIQSSGCSSNVHTNATNKSIYQTVLQQRQMKLKMKKKMI